MPHAQRIYSLPTKQVSAYATTSLVILVTFLIILLTCMQLNIVLKRHFPCGHKNHVLYITCSGLNKPLTGLIGLAYATASLAVALPNWVARCSLTFWNLAEASKYNVIYLAFNFYKPSNSDNNNSLFLLLHVLWKVKIDYISIKYYWQIQNTSSCFSLIDILLWKFDTSLTQKKH